MTQTITRMLSPSLLQKKGRIVILLGPPGCGKGTQAPLLKSHLQMPHISTGDLFRSHIQNQTEVGKRAKEFIDEGKLVPDEIVLDMLFERLSQKDCTNGAILDGFPRTVTQAKALDQRIQSSHNVIVVRFTIDKPLLIERIAGRLSCPDCGSSFHKTYAPPKNAMVCDACNGALHTRKDDTLGVLDKRMDVYFRQTLPLVQYFTNKPGVLHEVDGCLPKGEVFSKIVNVLPEVEELPPEASDAQPDNDVHN